MWQHFLSWLQSPSREAPIWMNLIPVISIVASAGVAIFVMIRNQRFTRDQGRKSFGESILPSIAFVQDDDLSVSMVNVGKGPAINISFRRSLQSIENGKAHITAAESAKMLPPLPVGARHPVYNLMEDKPFNLFKAEYSNIFNDRLYSTVFDKLTRENTFRDLGPKNT